MGPFQYFSVSSYQLLGWTSLNGPMRVCAHQLPGWVHKSDLEQSQEIHVFASCCVMRLVVGLRTWWTRFIALGNCLMFVRLSRCRCFVAHLLLSRGV